MVGHRASLAGAMYRACQAKHPNITFHFGHTLTAITSFSPPTCTITPRNDSSAPITLTPALILAADGIKSVARTTMLAALDHTAGIQDTRQAAYRIMLTRAQCAHDAELLSYFDADAVTRWIGESRHIIAYPVSGKQIYNLSTVQPDTHFAAATNATYTTKGSKETMMGVFADFAPVVRRMLDLVPEGEVCEWKLRVHEPLPTWVHGQMALVGDACHPTLPHLAQGAAQAIEDGAVLGVVLSLCPDASPESIEKTLRVYESVRKERAETLVDIAAASGRELHLGEGKAKKERDEAFARLKAGEGKVPDRWADADVQKKIYGFDCMKVAEEEFERLFGEAKVARERMEVG
ncbi:FAD/NAD(P)-binding domain-containing protein [Pseudovirgaria hyperparasitica]|uniref:FAD/NAD(P)-binding domain-containing protein n=1 Tax=Pseudovirgaria hyperparasitica TaxID=470096 RepID=A0A6A6W0Q2_9PEZI|nr:FAD/NAD(P)-binding domain-containing protein [Pseudovirgaria hyperparasitica]KAF2756123.1 FAD/NAD(P)-binding domain-containing protein [Pseudovirgaria hyperparasitica]